MTESIHNASAAAPTETAREELEPTLAATTRADTSCYNEATTAAPSPPQVGRDIR